MSLPQEILAGAQKGYKGSFTLAVEKAREKLKRFQLTDPRYYILQVIEALLASGATDIRISHEVVLSVDLTFSSYILIIEFDGPGYTREELEQLYDFLFISQADRQRDRLRELALALMSCQALRPTVLKLESQGTVWQRCASDKPEEHLKERVLERASQAGSRLEIRGPGKGSEVELLRSYCTLVQVPILVNGEQISATPKSLTGVCPWPNYRFTRGQLSGWIGLPYAEMARSSLTFLRYGVQFARRLEHRLTPAVSVVLEDPRIRKNASQTDVVEDDGYFEVLQEVQQVLFEFALEFSRKYIPGYQRQAVQNFLSQLLCDWMSPEVLLSAEQDTTPELQQLLNLPLFTDRLGQMWPLKDVVAQYRKDGFVSICSRRMPHAHRVDWLVLNPGPDESSLLKSLFDRIRNVDEEIKRIQALGTGRATPAPAPNTSPALAERAVTGGGFSCVLRIPNDYPAGSLELFFPAQQGWVRHTDYFNGLSMQVEITGPWRADAVRLARTAVEENYAELYRHLLARLLKSHRTPQHRQPILRALEHLLAYWSSLFPTGWPGARKFNERMISARNAVGEEIWQAQVFATRSGSLVSLNDMSVWLGSFESLALAYGGRPIEGDHAIDGSPAVARFLSLIFGTERIQRVTLGTALLPQRQKQRLLPGAAENPAQLVEVEAAAETDDPDLEEISLDALRAAMEAEMPTPEPPPPPPPQPRVETEELPGPDESEEPEEIPASTDSEPLPPPEFSPVPEPVRTQSEETITLLAISFSQEGLAGWLALTAQGSGTVSVCQGGHEVAGGVLLELPVTGWVVAADNRSLVVENGLVFWTEDQGAVLLGHLERLYEELAQWMADRHPQGREFRRGRELLVHFLGRFPDLTRSRLERCRPGDPIGSLKFLPAAGGTLCSLATFYEETRTRGSLHVIQEFGLNPDMAYPVAVVGRTVSESFYRELLGVETLHPFRESERPIEERFLQVLRRELRLLRERGDFRLSDEILAGIDWQANAAHFVEHNPATRTTGLDLEHRIVREVLRRFDHDRRLLPMLLSSLYTAINRALEEVGDEDELEFLETLLEVYPDEQARQQQTGSLLKDS